MLVEMDARLCPRCQWGVIKDEGCAKVMYRKCKFRFGWNEMEMVLSCAAEDAGSEPSQVSASRSRSTHEVQVEGVTRGMGQLVQDEHGHGEASETEDCDEGLLGHEDGQGTIEEVNEPMAPHNDE